MNFKLDSSDRTVSRREQRLQSNRLFEDTIAIEIPDIELKAESNEAKFIGKIQPIIYVTILPRLVLNHLTRKKIVIL